MKGVLGSIQGNPLEELRKRREAKEAKEAEAAAKAAAGAGVSAPVPAVSVDGSGRPINPMSASLKGLGAVGLRKTATAAGAGESATVPAAPAPDPVPTAPATGLAGLGRPNMGALFSVGVPELKKVAPAPAAVAPAPAAVAPKPRTKFEEAAAIIAAMQGGRGAGGVAIKLAPPAPKEPLPAFKDDEPWIQEKKDVNYLDKPDEWNNRYYLNPAYIASADVAIQAIKDKIDREVGESSRPLLESVRKSIIEVELSGPSVSTKLMQIKSMILSKGSSKANIALSENIIKVLIDQSIEELPSIKEKRANLEAARASLAVARSESGKAAKGGGRKELEANLAAAITQEEDLRKKYQEHVIKEKEEFYENPKKVSAAKDKILADTEKMFGEFKGSIGLYEAYKYFNDIEGRMQVSIANARMNGTVSTEIRECASSVVLGMVDVMSDVKTQFPAIKRMVALKDNIDFYEYGQEIVSRDGGASVPVLKEQINAMDKISKDFGSYLELKRKRDLCKKFKMVVDKPADSAQVAGDYAKYVTTKPSITGEKIIVISVVSGDEWNPGLEIIDPERFTKLRPIIQEKKAAKEASDKAAAAKTVAEAAALKKEEDRKAGILAATAGMSVDDVTRLLAGRASTPALAHTSAPVSVVSKVVTASVTDPEDASRRVTKLKALGMMMAAQKAAREANASKSKVETGAEKVRALRTGVSAPEPAALPLTSTAVERAESKSEVAVGEAPRKPAGLLGALATGGDGLTVAQGLLVAKAVAAPAPDPALVPALVSTPKAPPAAPLADAARGPDVGPSAKFRAEMGTLIGGLDSVTQSLKSSEQRAVKDILTIFDRFVSATGEEKAAIKKELLKYSSEYLSIAAEKLEDKKKKEGLLDLSGEAFAMESKVHGLARANAVVTRVGGIGSGEMELPGGSRVRRDSTSSFKAARGDEDEMDRTEEFSVRPITEAPAPVLVAAAAPPPPPPPDAFRAARLPIGGMRMLASPIAEASAIVAPTKAAPAVRLPSVLATPAVSLRGEVSGSDPDSPHSSVSAGSGRSRSDSDDDYLSKEDRHTRDTLRSVAARLGEKIKNSTAGKSPLVPPRGEGKGKGRE